GPARAPSRASSRGGGARGGWTRPPGRGGGQAVGGPGKDQGARGPPVRATVTEGTHPLVPGGIPDVAPGPARRRLPGTAVRSTVRPVGGYAGGRVAGPARTIGRLPGVAAVLPGRGSPGRWLPGRWLPRGGVRPARPGRWTHSRVRCLLVPVRGAGRGAAGCGPARPARRRSALRRG